jgi:hypothetical protein
MNTFILQYNLHQVIPNMSKKNKAGRRNKNYWATWVLFKTGWWRGLMEKVTSLQRSEKVTKWPGGYQGEESFSREKIR